MYNSNLPVLIYEDSLNQILSENNYLAIKVSKNADLYNSFHNNNFIQTLLHGDSFQPLLKNTYIKVKKLDSEYEPVVESQGFYVSISNTSFRVLDLDNTLQYIDEDIYEVVEDRVIYQNTGNLIDNNDYFLFEIEEYLFIFDPVDLNLVSLSGRCSIEYPNSDSENSVPQVLITNIGAYPEPTDTSYIPYFNKRDFTGVEFTSLFSSFSPVRTRVKVNGFYKEVWGIAQTDLLHQVYSRSSNDTYVNNNSITVYVNQNPEPYNPTPEPPVEPRDFVFGNYWDSNTESWVGVEVPNDSYTGILSKDDLFYLTEYGLSWFKNSSEEAGTIGSPSYNPRIKASLLALYSDLGVTQIDTDLTKFKITNDSDSTYWLRSDYPYTDTPIMSFKVRFTPIPPITGGEYKTVEFDVTVPVLYNGPFKTIEFDCSCPIVKQQYKTIEFDCADSLVQDFKTIEFDVVVPIQKQSYNTVSYPFEEPYIPEFKTVEFDTYAPISGGEYDSDTVIIDSSYPIVYQYSNSGNSIQSIAPDDGFDTELHYDSNNIYAVQTDDGNGNITRNGWESQVMPLPTVSVTGDFDSNNQLYADTNNSDVTVSAGDSVLVGRSGSSVPEPVTYDSSKSYAVIQWSSYQGISGQGRTEFEIINNNDSIYVQNNTQESLDLNSIRVAVCSDSSADVIAVHDAQNNYNAFKYTFNNVDYYYVLDGVQNDWVSDLSSIGYSLGLGYIEVFFYLTLYKNSVTFSSYDYWSSIVIDSTDKGILEDFGVPLSLGDEEYFISKTAKNNFVITPVGLYSGVRTGNTEADMSNFYCDTNEYYNTEYSGVYSGICIWSIDSYNTPVTTWKCRIKRIR